MPVKVYDLAKELKKSNTEMLGVLSKLGFTKLSPTSDLDDASADKVRAAVEPAAATSNGNGAAPAASGAGEAVEVAPNISIKDLAEKLGINANEIQKILMGMGVLAGLNQRLAPDAIQRIAQKLNRTVRTSSAAPAPVATPANGAAATVAPANGAKPVVANGAAPVATKPATARVSGGTAASATGGKAKIGSAQTLLPRPPVVTIMGHVDHGKTTLLDALRKTSVAAGETGGITQHIGAYQVDANGQRITFLDTPGHAAFGAMRARGAKVTDIVVIVVAADDSIMPQTEEAIKLAKEANVPIIIAVNKIDLPDANPDKVLTDLTSYEIVPEAFGGDTITVNISAKTGEGLPDLLDNILLVSEASVEPKADPHGKFQGTVIEAKIDKGRGAVVSVLVQNGTLRMGDIVLAGTHFGKIKGMTDEKGAKVVKAGPSVPVEIVGFGTVPDAGDRVETAKDEKEARALTGNRDDALRAEKLGERNNTSLEALYKTLRFGAVKELNLVIKGDVQGSVQAVRESLEPLGNDEVRVRVLHSGVGAITENDVLLAASDKDAEEKNSLVVGFNVPISGPAEKKAEQEHVQIKTFGIIYELIDSVTESLVGLLEPIYEEAVLGKAEVRQLFRLPGGRSIAGSYVTDGLIRRNAKARVLRGKDVIATADIDTLKRFKDDARDVQTGYECGITLRDFNNLAVGDVLECFEMRAVPRTL